MRLLVLFCAVIMSATGCGLLPTQNEPMDGNASFNRLAVVRGHQVIEWNGSVFVPLTPPDVVFNNISWRGGRRAELVGTVTAPASLAGLVNVSARTGEIRSWLVNTGSATYTDPFFSSDGLWGGYVVTTPESAVIVINHYQPGSDAVREQFRLNTHGNGIPLRPSISTSGLWVAYTTTLHPGVIVVRDIAADTLLATYGDPSSPAVQPQWASSQTNSHLLFFALQDPQSGQSTIFLHYVSTILGIRRCSDPGAGEADYSPAPSFDPSTGLTNACFFIRRNADSTYEVRRSDFYGTDPVSRRSTQELRSLTWQP